MYFYAQENIPLYYEVFGKGPPLLLIAGLASDSRSWQPILSGLRDTFTLIVPDNRGAGRSCQECLLSIDQIADDCHALIRSLGFERVNLLGHSMGGMAAMTYAARYPQALDKLVLVSAAAENSARNNLLFSDWATAYATGSDRAAWFRNIFFWIFTEPFFHDQRAVDLAVHGLLHDPWPQSPQAFRRQVEAIAEWNGADLLGRIAAPTRVITGDRDLLFPLENASRLVQLIADAHLVVIEEAAHSIHMEQPQAFLRSVADFLAS